MPYKLRGTKVYKKEDGKWKLLKDYAGEKNARRKALAYFRKLKMVEEEE